MPKRKSGTRAKGKVFLNVEMSPELRHELRLAALEQHMNLKDWLPIVLRKHLSETRESPAYRG